MNIKDLQATTLVGPTRENLKLNTLAVLHLDNHLLNKTDYDQLTYIIVIEVKNQMDG